VDGAVGSTPQIGSTPGRITMRVDQAHHYFNRRSAPPSQNTPMLAFQRLLLLSHLGRDARASLPLSASAFSTRPFSVCADQPIFDAIDKIACQRNPC
jgi:hypothetical protein